MRLLPAMVVAPFTRCFIVRSTLNGYPFGFLPRTRHAHSAIRDAAGVSRVSFLLVLLLLGLPRRAPDSFGTGALAAPSSPLTDGLHAAFKSHRRASQVCSGGSQIQICGTGRVEAQVLSHVEANLLWRDYVLVSICGALPSALTEPDAGVTTASPAYSSSLPSVSPSSFTIIIVVITTGGHF